VNASAERSRHLYEAAALVRAELDKLEEADFSPSRQLMTDFTEAVNAWWKACETWLR
jgi:hypothetical protein